MPKGKIKSLAVVLVALSVVVATLMLDLFVLRPTRIESYSKGTAHGFAIGMPKPEAFSAAKAKQFRSIWPKPGELQWFEDCEFSFDLQTSNYWIVVLDSQATYLLAFRDEKLWRVVAYFSRFGELDGALGLFAADNPKPNQFQGLTDEQVDDLLRSYEPAVRVHLF